MLSGQNRVLSFPANGVSIACSNIPATQELAETLSASLRRGDVVLLDGDLAAGKTAFVAMVCKALGTFDQPTSPTYVIQNTYLCPKFEIFHIDAYRLAGIEEFLELGIDEFFTEAVAFIEWGDRVIGAVETYLRIRIDFNEFGQDARTYRFTSSGSRWNEFIATLAVHPLRCGATE